ncbi:replication protein A1-like protein, partial [Trifolium medium]|nr:replication protein A1-like protein [Trifolium medium]
MARSVDLIKDINADKELWKLAVRVEDLWKSGVGRNEHLEFLILDKQGDNIQVLLPNDLCPLWESKLHEGTTYVMKNFKVQPNDFKVKFTDHPFMLLFVGGDGGSDVIPTRMTNIPEYSFKFKPFAEIKSGNYRPDLLV